VLAMVRAMTEGESSPIVRRIARALLEAQDERLELAIRKICKRFDVAYVDKEDEPKRTYMLADIGRRFIFESKEFNEKKRGRKPKETTNDIELAKMADWAIAASARMGERVTSKQIAVQLAEAIQEVSTKEFVDPRGIAEAISRGRKKLREMEAQFVRKRN
jgi:hypothetical protein